MVASPHHAYRAVVSASAAFLPESWCVPVGVVGVKWDSCSDRCGVPFFCLSDDPQDAQVARQYKSNMKLFEATAKQWTEQYAMPQRVDQGSFAICLSALTSKASLCATSGRIQHCTVVVAYSALARCWCRCWCWCSGVACHVTAGLAKIENLVSMGFDKEKARAALVKFNWESDPALDFLLNNS